MFFKISHTSRMSWQLTQAGLDMPVWNCLSSRLLLAEILKCFFLIMLILYFACLLSVLLKTLISGFYFYLFSVLIFGHLNVFWCSIKNFLKLLWSLIAHFWVERTNFQEKSSCCFNSPLFLLFAFLHCVTRYTKSNLSQHYYTWPTGSPTGCGKSVITLEVTLLQILEKESFFFLNILSTVFLTSCRPAHVSDGGSDGLKSNRILATAHIRLKI